MDHVRAGIELEQRDLAAPFAAEPGGERLKIRRRVTNKSGVEIVPSVECADRATKTLRSKAGRNDPTVIAPAEMQPFRPAAVLQKSHQPAGHAGGKPNR